MRDSQAIVREQEILRNFRTAFLIALGGAALENVFRRATHEHCAKRHIAAVGMSYKPARTALDLCVLSIVEGDLLIVCPSLHVKNQVKTNTKLLKNYKQLSRLLDSINLRIEQVILVAENSKDCIII